MSVSLYRWTEACEGVPCPGDCDLCSREDAIDALDGVKVDEENCAEYDIGYNDGIDFAVSSLSVLPSTQPKIIRCKDCKWYGRADKRRFYRGMDCLQKRIDTIIPDKDFCSRAERREE